MNRVFCILSLAATLLGAGLTAPVAAQTAAPPALRVIVFPGGFNWPIWVAEEQGFFAANKVAVGVTPTPSSVFQLTGLIDGRFDIAETAIDNIIAYDEGQGEAAVEGTPDLVAIMGGDNGFLHLVAVPDVKTYAELKGRQLTVDALTTGYAFVLEDMLRRAGLGPTDYSLVKAGGVLERFDDLMSRKHAGTLLLSPFEVLAEAKGFHDLGAAIDQFGHYQGLVAAVRRSWAKDHGPELVGYIRAYRQALDWLFDPANKEAAIAILRAHIPTMSAPLAEASYGILLNPTRGFARDAGIDLAGVQTVLRLRSEYGRPQKTLDDPGKYLDLSYYEAASKRAD